MWNFGLFSQRTGPVLFFLPEACGRIIWGEIIVISRKSRRRKSKWLFFLLFALIITGISTMSALLLALGAPADLALSASAGNSRPVLVWKRQGNVVVAEINVPASPDDKWRIKDNRFLEFTLNNIEGAGHIENWAEQYVAWRPENDGAVVSFELDNLPPVYTVKRNETGYRIEWSKSGLAGKRIAIDPGHGGHDPGAIGYHVGLKEKDVTLVTALALQRLLEQAGAEVFMTRSSDTLVEASVQPGQHIRPDLWKRRNIVNDWSPDFFISLHNNSWRDRLAGGFETYYNNLSLNSPNGKRAARMIQDRLVAEFNRRDRGIKYKESSDAVLQIDDFPSVLAEMLFISNKTEEKILAEPDFAQRAAQAVFMGINDYFSSFGGDNYAVSP